MHMDVKTRSPPKRAWLALIRDGPNAHEFRAVLVYIAIADILGR